MDRWPGAYPPSEPATPAQEMPQQQQHQQSQHAAGVQSQRHPQGLAEQPVQSAAQQVLAGDRHSQFPSQDQLTRENKNTQGTAAHALKDTGVGLSNAEYHRLQGRTLQDERNPSVDEAVGGGTYVRDATYPPERVEAVPKHHFEGGWPLSNVSVQNEGRPMEQQPHKIHDSHSHGIQAQNRDVQQQPLAVQDQLHRVHDQDVAQQRSHESQPHAYATHQYQAPQYEQSPREAQQRQTRGLAQQSRTAQQGTADLSHGHQPSNLPVAYQQQAREAPSQPHAYAAHQYQAPAYDQAPREAQQSRAVQQGTSSLGHGHQPSDLPIAYQEQTREAPHKPHELRHENRELGQQPDTAPQTSHGLDQRSTTSSQSASNQRSSTPPYWGSLPTATTGGIYNTVTGHGSARDDHDQHHGLAPKQRTPERTSADASIPSGSTTVPSGGIYNTVTGHGSGDEPSHRNTSESNTAGLRHPFVGTNAGPGQHTARGEDALSGPQSRNVRHTSTSGGSPTGATHADQTQPSGTQRSFPLTSSNQETHPQSHSHGKEGLAAGALAGTGVAAYEYGKCDTHNAVDDRNVPASQAYQPSGAEQRATHSQPVQHHSHTHSEQKMSSPEYTDKQKEHHGLFGFGSRPDKEDARDSKHTTTKHDYTAAAAQQRTAHTQPVDDKNVHKEHRGLFGSGGRHGNEEGRDSRDIAPIPGTHPAVEEHHRIIPAKPQAQAISPPNEEEKHKEHHGLLGFGGGTKHTQEEKRDSRDIAPIPGTHPASHDHRAAQVQPISPANAEAKRRSLDAGERSNDGSPRRKGSILGGIFHRHKDDQAHEEPKQQHRRSDSIERRKLHKDPPPAVAQAMRQSTPPQKNSIEEERYGRTGNTVGALPTQRQGHGHASQDVHPSAGTYASPKETSSTAARDARHAQQFDSTTEHNNNHRALAAGAGAAAGGIAASELAHRHAESKDTARHSEVADTSSRGATDSGPYNKLASGTPSGVASGMAGASQQSRVTHNASNAAQDNHRPTDTTESGKYNTLSDGTPSGIATSTATGHAADTRNTASSAPYDHSTGSHHRSEEIAAGAGAAGLISASRHTKDNGPFNTHGSTEQTRLAQPGPDSWRTDLPPTAGQSISATHDAILERQLAGSSNTGTSSYVPASTTHTDQSACSRTSEKAGGYDTLASGTASGIAAGGAATAYTASHAGAGTATHADKEASVPRTLRQTQESSTATSGASDMPQPYNVLPSGTPSGVNIEYRRRSKEIERQHHA